MTTQPIASDAQLKSDIKQRLIIDRLELEDITAADIADDMPLFGEGLGLDSVEAFEIMVGLEELYNVLVEGIPADEIKLHLANVNAIAAFIAAQSGAKP